MLANGMNTIVPSTEFRIDHIWVYQTNRYIDYPALEIFNYF